MRPIKREAHVWRLCPASPAACCCSCPTGVDYYRVELAVPEEAYEINFVFSNGEGTFDNNLTQVGGGAAACWGVCWVSRCREERQGHAACWCAAQVTCSRQACSPWAAPASAWPPFTMLLPPHPPIPSPQPSGPQNYLKPVEGPMTRDLWIDTAPERAVRRWGGGAAWALWGGALVQGGSTVQWEHGPRGQAWRRGAAQLRHEGQRCRSALCYQQRAPQPSPRALRQRLDPQTLLTPLPAPAHLPPRHPPAQQEAAWQKMKAEEAARKAEEEAAALAAKEAKDQRLADEGVEQIKRCGGVCPGWCEGQVGAGRGCGDPGLHVRRLHAHASAAAHQQQQVATHPRPPRPTPCPTQGVQEPA